MFNAKCNLSLSLFTPVSNLPLLQLFWVFTAKSNLLVSKFTPVSNQRHTDTASMVSLWLQRLVYTPTYIDQSGSLENSNILQPTHCYFLVLSIICKKIDYRASVEAACGLPMDTKNAD